jgi:hypothetical protein
MPMASNAKEFICTIQCKDKTGSLKEVTVQVNAPDKEKAENALIGFINLTRSKAAEICKSKGYEGLFVQKEKKVVNCR